LRLLRKPETLLDFVADRPAHDRRYRVDPARLVSLGWQPRWRFEAGLAATVDWYAQHSEWWQPIKSGAYREYYERNYADRQALLAV
jgi:dTDP-glucose 4,6-dehydratase